MRLRPALCFLFLCSALLRAASAQSYMSVVVIGDSLTDTGNDATLSRNLYTTAAQVPGPATGYTDGRFTSGKDTTPVSNLYSGVWLEQLVAQFPAKPVVKNSLAGGTNYAYGFATTNSGTSVFAYGPSNALTFTVANMGQQVTTYLATKPTINTGTLFVVWGGANDLIAAQTTQDVQNAALREVALIQTLINAGATEFLVPNLPDLGLVPRYNTNTNLSVAATLAATAFNATLSQSLATLQTQNTGRTLHLFTLDTFSLFHQVTSFPSTYGLTNVTASSQANVNVNPDTYLFWDDLHPTTKGHSLLAAAAETLLTTTNGTSSASITGPTALSLTAGGTVSGAYVAYSSAAYTGTVTFSCANLPAHMSCSFSPASGSVSPAVPLGTQLTIGSTATASLLMPGERSSGTVFAFVFLPGAAMGLLLVRRRRTLAMVLVFSCGLIALAGCAGGSGGSASNQTAAGSYTIQMVATANNISQGQSVTVTVK